MPGLKKMINMYYFMPKFSINNAPLGWYADMLNNNTIFSFARYGDGEWAAILGEKGKNCDGHEYFPEMSALLRKTITDPTGNYLFGLQNYAVRQMGRSIYNFIKMNKVKIPWHYSDVFHHANINGQLFPFIKALQKKPVVVIGPDYLREIDRTLLAYTHFIGVPQVNCFLEKDRIETAITDYAAKNKGVVYLFSASMATKCFIHDLYPLIGSENWMIDAGSLWDGYLGVNTRGFCRKYDWGERLLKNTGRA